MTALEKYYHIPDDEVRTLIDAREDLAEQLQPDAPEVQKLDSQLAAMRERAVAGAAKRHQYLQAKLAGLRSEMSALLEALEADERWYVQRMAAMERVIKQALPPGPDAEIVTDSARVYYAESSAIEVQDVEALPIECLKVTTEPIKREIEARLDKGEQVPGAVRVINYHLRIGPGGDRARKNAANRQKRRAAKVIDGKSAFKEIGRDE